jgi:hypothetical protein
MFVGKGSEDGRKEDKVVSHAPMHPSYRPLLPAAVAVRQPLR